VTRPFPLLPHVAALQPVVHGGAAQLVARGIDPADLDDFSATLLPVAPPPAVRQAIADTDPRPYPDPANTRLRTALAARHGLGPEQVLCGNGSVAIIRAIARACLSTADTALVVGPTFGEYAAAVDAVGARLVEIHTDDASTVCDAIDRHAPALVFLCNPNNPTGHRWPDTALDTIARRAPLVIDEAYMDFIRPRPQPAIGPGRVVLRSLTKDHAMAGLRVGYALGDPALLAALDRVLDPWGLSAVAESAALAALRTPAPYDAAIDRLWAERDRLVAAISAMGLRVDARAAPFFLVDVGDEDGGAAAVTDRLLHQGILVRDCTSFGLPRHIRISPQTPDAGDRLLSALSTVLRPGRADRAAPHTHPPHGEPPT